MSGIQDEIVLRHPAQDDAGIPISDFELHINLNAPTTDGDRTICNYSYTLRIPSGEEYNSNPAGDVPLHDVFNADEVVRQVIVNLYTSIPQMIPDQELAIVIYNDMHDYLEYVLYQNDQSSLNSTLEESFELPEERLSWDVEAIESPAGDDLVRVHGSSVPRVEGDSDDDRQDRLDALQAELNAQTEEAARLDARLSEMRALEVELDNIIEREQQHPSLRSEDMTALQDLVRRYDRQTIMDTLEAERAALIEEARQAARIELDDEQNMLRRERPGRERYGVALNPGETWIARADGTLDRLGEGTFMFRIGDVFYTSDDRIVGERLSQEYEVDGVSYSEEYILQSLSQLLRDVGEARDKFIAEFQEFASRKSRDHFEEERMLQFLDNYLSEIGQGIVLRSNMSTHILNKSVI